MSQKPELAKDLLPETNYDSMLSEAYNPHLGDLEETTMVDFLPTVSDIDSRDLIITERRQRGIENVQYLKTILSLNETLERSRIDSLTGLRNRDAFEVEAPAIFERSKPGEFNCFYIDLNGLKRANNYGHDVGDRYLRGVSQFLLDSVRPYDLVYRVGGDEIVILLGGFIDESLFKKIGNRLQDDISSKIDELDLPKDLYLGISIGGSAKNEGDTFEDCKNRADRESNANKEAYYQDIYDKTGLDLRR